MFLMEHFEVIKASGEREPLDRGKMRRSLKDTGLANGDADDVIDKVLATLTPPVSTKKLYRAVKKHMRARSPVSTYKYSLKDAIYSLGPTGYPFERYVGKILEEEGYEVKVGEFVEGKCVTHEVDVVATKGNTCYMVECKFHHNGKNHSNVKTALYVHARFLDIREACRDSEMNRKGFVPRGMLVTNTRFTSEARKYAECVGIKTIGWKHPAGESLERLIEDGRTYPVTVLPAVNRKNVGLLIERDLVTVKDVGRLASPDELVRLTGLGSAVARRVHDQASSICLNNRQ
jgi:hypothetical protein